MESPEHSGPEGRVSLERLLGRRPKKGHSRKKSKETAVNNQKMQTLASGCWLPGLKSGAVGRAWVSLSDIKRR